MRRVAPGRMALVGLLGSFGLLSGAGGAGAATCALDTVPAATLLLPYFEVDLGNPSGRTTLFSIGNAGAEAALAHVVLWTDAAVATMVFDVYLTGFDVETVNLRDLFNGLVPRTADVAGDPADEVSPRGELSQDASFPGCALPPAMPDPAFVEHLRRSHQGLSSSLLNGRCAGLRYGDGMARGFVTVDVATRCSLLVPGDSGYFGPGGVAGTANVLWGDFLYVDPAGNFAQGENLVRIEADPARFVEDRRTFYGWTGSAGADGREPLGRRWASRFLDGGPFTAGTDFVVWREPSVAGETFSCTAGHPNWYPLPKEEVVSFDEEETPEVPTCNGGGFASCSSAGLPAGSYEARAGELRVAFTVPGTAPPEGLCAGDPF